MKYCIFCKLNALHDLCDDDHELKNDFIYYFWDTIINCKKNNSDWVIGSLGDYVHGYFLNGHKNGQLMMDIYDDKINPKSHIKKKIKHLNH